MRNHHDYSVAAAAAAGGGLRIAKQFEWHESSALTGMASVAAKSDSVVFAATAARRTYPTCI